MIAQYLNNMFEHNIDINTGDGELVPLPKPPPKEKGPVENLRPINLLPIIRKIFSKITLNRCKQKFDEYLPPTQHAYRNSKSTTDVIWMYRWMIAKAIEENITIYITGIDMSSAFDTIDRGKLLTILEGIIDEDEQRMSRVLLTDTTINVRVKGAETTPFVSNLGSPQGDGISGPYFNVYFENANRKQRAALPPTPQVQPQVPDHVYILEVTHSMPVESTYADDDATTDPDRPQMYINVVEQVLAEEDLIVNKSKTEQTVIKKDTRINEKWRTVKKLGSLLGDSEDISRRKQLACASMKSVKHLWIKKKMTKQNTRIKLYKSMVKHVLTYNLKACGFTVHDRKKLDSFHRRQLKRVLGITWPNKIKSEKLYKITKSKPLSVEITESRWQYFGHVLRMDENAPAQKAMTWYFEGRIGRLGFGRRRTSIVETLNNDIILARTHYPTLEIFPMYILRDLNCLRRLASDRLKWKQISKLVVASAYDKVARELKLEFRI